jgi:error-prone DNA polymerase
MRDDFNQRGILPAAKLIDARPGSIVEVAGLVLVRQRPGTATGIIFATLEDEGGIVNVVIWPRVFEANRQLVLGSRLMAVRGEVQREGLVIHVIARSFTNHTPHLMALANGQSIIPQATRADEVKTGSRPDPRQYTARRRMELDAEARAALPSGRNFH